MGLAPTGYMHTFDENGNKTIVPNSNIAPFISKIFELYATGTYSVAKLRDAITEMGGRTKKGNKFANSLIN